MRFRPSPFVGWTLAALVLVPAFVCAVFGYRYTAHRWCSQCWASMVRQEYGLAVSTHLRLPFSRSVEVNRESEHGIARFLAPAHRHDSDRPGMSSSMRGPYLGGFIACGGEFPSAFARALAGTEGFADYVAARVADGSVAVETVRALIAVPGTGHRSSLADDPDRFPLLRRGCDLYAGFQHVDPRACGLWGDVDPFESASPAQKPPCPGPRHESR